MIAAGNGRVLAVTGHRPNKLGGYDFWAPQRIWVRAWLTQQIEQRRPAYVISGMALGVDQDFAFVALERGIHVLAAIPFEGQEREWPAPSQQFYHQLLSCTFHRVVVCEGGYAAWKMQRRNEWMVDHCDDLLAVWNGDLKGGTANCVDYARRIGRPFYRLDPQTFSP